ncbi:U2 small nuclear ribonucleoprotein B' [Exophiala viscosa]|uniref:U2 small nuclear ribonucleoprotein B n=1 Tax=Exophiala viscosa TaxID=2486360 RepID=A0AAN6DX26_9EURO|nr:U2 small nuclear ribonucleoprotein B' [Exophiala viscosa]KAI1621682.1 U2 small nuclear ribonucleoprotein B' [Exophiala viscosa]
MSAKAAQNAPGAKESQNAGTPNQTLYLKNLDEKTNKTELKRALYMLFTQFGPVLDIVTARIGSKSQKMRGQAHIVFRDIQTATQAMRALQGFDFLGKELVISYGKGQSSIIPKLRGTFEPPTAAAGTAESTALQKSIFNAPPSAIPSKPVENGVKPSEATAAVVPHGTKRTREEEDEEEEEDVPMEEDEDDAPMEDSDDD